MQEASMHSRHEKFETKKLFKIASFKITAEIHSNPIHNFDPKLITQLHIQNKY